MSTRNLSLNYLLAGVIIVVATILRFWQLGEYPIHLTNDEAALGYNAYSILQTGRDEHGEVLPIIFKSFGDWKPGLYVYLTVPFVFLFGLTETAVRFPSALAGVVAVVLVYAIGRKLFTEKVALLAALTLSVMPWHIHFSRGAWEANIALTLLLAGVFFLIHSFDDNKYLILSAAFFGISLWAYQSAKLASLLPLLAFAYAFRDKILSLNRNIVFTSLLVGLAFALPILVSTLNGKGGRIEVVSVFSYARPDRYIQETIFDHEDIEKNDIAFAIFHSEAFDFFRGIASRYSNYLSGRFLFFEGDWSNEKHTSPGSGYLLYAQIPFLFAGTMALFKKSIKSEHLFILIWLLLAPLPAALTRDSVHGVRSLNLLIPLSFTIALGIAYINRMLATKKLVNYFGMVVIFVAFIASMFLYTDSYFIQNPVETANKYLYGYKQVVEKIKSSSKKYDKIIVDQSYDQPYIFFLFYNKYDPDLFQENKSYVAGKNGDVGFVTNLGNIEFRPLNWNTDKSLNNSLIIGKPIAFPPNVVSNQDHNIEIVRYPNGNVAFYLVETI